MLADRIAGIAIGKNYRGATRPSDHVFSRRRCDASGLLSSILRNIAREMRSKRNAMSSSMVMTIRCQGTSL
jgi:hypothetical protein